MPSFIVGLRNSNGKPFLNHTQRKLLLALLSCFFFTPRSRGQLFFLRQTQIKFPRALPLFVLKPSFSPSREGEIKFRNFKHTADQTLPFAKVLFNFRIETGFQRFSVRFQCGFIFSSGKGNPTEKKRVSKISLNYVNLQLFKFN